MPSATAREFQRVAETLDFEKRRQTGPPLFFKILRQLGVSQNEFDQLR